MKFVESRNEGQTDTWLFGAIVSSEHQCSTISEFIATLTKDQRKRLATRLLEDDEPEPVGAIVAELKGGR